MQNDRTLASPQARASEVAEDLAEELAEIAFIDAATSEEDLICIFCGKTEVRCRCKASRREDPEGD